MGVYPWQPREVVPRVNIFISSGHDKRQRDILYRDEVLRVDRKESCMLAGIIYNSVKKILLNINDMLIWLPRPLALFLLSYRKFIATEKIIMSQKLAILLIYIAKKKYHRENIINQKTNNNKTSNYRDPALTELEVLGLLLLLLLSTRRMRESRRLPCAAPLSLFDATPEVKNSTGPSGAEASAR